MAPLCWAVRNPTCPLEHSHFCQVERHHWGFPYGCAFSYRQHRTPGWRESGGTDLQGVFAAIGLGLVLLGVYSLVAYTVARRTHEIGIRMAVGASRRDVLHLTVAIGARWIGLGVAVGLLASLAATRLLTSQLWGVSPTDPLTLASVIGVVAMSAVVASYIPARRATRVDLMVVLRSE